MFIPGRHAIVSWKQTARFLVVMVLMMFPAGCAKAPGETENAWELFRATSLADGAFTGQRVGILPAVRIEFDPAQEVYRETLAGFIYDAFIKLPQGPEVLPIDIVQSRINAAGLNGEVLAMYGDYEKTSVLRKDALAKLGQAVGARYMLLPKLLRFQQEVFDRMTVFGLSVLRTRQSTVDIQAQLWDTTTGEAVWQGVGEGSQAAEVIEGRPVSFMSVAQYACESLASRLPWAKPASDQGARPPLSSPSGMPF